MHTSWLLTRHAFVAGGAFVAWWPLGSSTARRAGSTGLANVPGLAGLPGCAGSHIPAGIALLPFRALLAWDAIAPDRAGLSLVAGVARLTGIAWCTGRTNLHRHGIHLSVCVRIACWCGVRFQL